LLLKELLREEEFELLEDVDKVVGDDVVGIGIGGNGSSTCMVVGFAFIRLVDRDRCSVFDTKGMTRHTI
jgi:hypothetical protein